MDNGCAVENNKIRCLLGIGNKHVYSIFMVTADYCIYHKISQGETKTYSQKGIERASSVQMQICPFLAKLLHFSGSKS